MNEILTCVLCGRRGVRDFEPADALSRRCVNRDACQRRVDEAAMERPFLPGSAESAAAAEPDAALAGIAREVEGLRKATETIPTLFKQVEDLARVVQDLAANIAARPAEGNAAMSWLVMPDDLQLTREVLDELCGWLREVFLRYADAAGALPECWLWHPDVVEELLWLMRVWIAAYQDEDASAGRAGDWHDRYRPGVVKRIKQATGNCSLENHQDGGSHYRPAPTVPLTDAVDQVAAWWATAREVAAPEPTAEQLSAAHVAQAEQRRNGSGRR
ncbi:hypothetical protein [Amycolatopsis sp. FDAARGOS 1241]|uniref:hypothetical protein n=1 Tax=Amycolatopsis sp. FDAARGOS 1241 TaxID=2778070 RepID=UPI00194FFC02|nr:hypothetical protein [Amycolatopsis sp. FDAARGOS 1241]QRP48868.1 hypothetical protein I6J71_14255 [Amycolatopsis sp. FDAARGOS 1241]